MIYTTNYKFIGFIRRIGHLGSIQLVLKILYSITIYNLLQITELPSVGINDKCSPQSCNAHVKSKPSSSSGNKALSAKYINKHKNDCSIAQLQYNK